MDTTLISISLQVQRYDTHAHIHPTRIFSRKNNELTPTNTHTHTQVLKSVERSIKFDESILRSFTHKIDDGKIFSKPTRNKDGEWKPNPKRSVRGL